MSQPQPPNTRQSGPQAKAAPKEGTLHNLKPGGPIMPTKQGYVNPGPTDNLRGVEPNTAMHRGTPNPQQTSPADKHGDHNPGFNADPHGHGIATPIQGNKGVRKHHSAPLPTPKAEGR